MPTLALGDWGDESPQRPLVYRTQENRPPIHVEIMNTINLNIDGLQSMKKYYLFKVIEVMDTPVGFTSLFLIFGPLVA